MASDHDHSWGNCIVITLAGNCILPLQYIHTPQTEPWLYSHKLFRNSQAEMVCIIMYKTVSAQLFLNNLHYLISHSLKLKWQRVVYNEQPSCAGPKIKPTEHMHKHWLPHLILNHIPYAASLAFFTLSSVNRGSY